MSLFELELADPRWVHLLWPALALVGVLAWLDRRPGAARISPTMRRRLIWAPSPARRIARIVGIAATLVVGVFALMRPQGRGETEATSGRTTADVVVVLDVSRSMLAADAAPTRLARAKAELGALVDRLERHRVGLVAFAGRAVTVAPLTPDHAFFRLVLDGTDPRTVGRGGTRIGDGLRAGLAAFGPEAASGARLLLLITDGEDHDSRVLEAAKAARAAGVRIVAIGFGSEEGAPITVVDPETGARTQVPDGPGGAPVISKLDGALLRQLALETEGAYVPAGTAALDLESIVAEHLTPLVVAGGVATTTQVPVERYPWFVLAVLIGVLGVAILSAPAPRGEP